MVITNAAAGDPNVKALVYINAFIPAQGDTAFGLPAPIPDPGTRRYYSRYFRLVTAL
jgi:hypothetical protein